MFTLLITSVFLVAVVALIVYFWQRSPSNSDAPALPPPPYSGLFSEDEDHPSRFLPEPATDADASRQSVLLLERASRGDKEALLQAHDGADENLYEQVLNLIVEGAAGSEKDLFGLVSFIARNDGLRANKRLAEEFLESWEAHPDRTSMPRMLHIAALSDDPSTYQGAVESALQSWREGRVPGMAGEELRMLAESEYWVLSATARSSGAGFVLKRRLAGLRRELATPAGSVS
jgi:hypothetical protein